MANESFEALKKFFSPKEEVFKHWYAPIDNFQYASSEFYQMIEKELAARKVPGLEMSRVHLAEGGLLSDNREYLRLKRERLVFDICAAPFGTSFFFSFRSVELPLGVTPAQFVIFVIAVIAILDFLLRVMGTTYGLVVLLVAALVMISIMRNSKQIKFMNLDAMLLKTPVITAIYEVFFRKETYHREDTRLMYVTTVNSITEKIVENITVAKGVKLLKRYDRKPINGDLYEEKPKPLTGDNTESSTSPAS